MPVKAIRMSFFQARVRADVRLRSSTTSKPTAARMRKMRISTSSPEDHVEDNVDAVEQRLTLAARVVGVADAHRYLGIGESGAGHDREQLGRVGHAVHREIKRLGNLA